MLHHMSPNIRHDLYYWVRHAKNSQAEVDYISSYLQVVVPVEVKADKQGGIKSLWSFMRDRNHICSDYLGLVCEVGPGDGIVDFICDSCGKRYGTFADLN